MFGLGGIELLIVLFLVSLPFCLWLWALVDVLKNDFVGMNKIIWLLVLIFLPPLGLLLYLLVGRGQRITPSQA